MNDRNIDFTQLDNEHKKDITYLLLQTKYQTVRGLLSGISHELKHPLNVAGVICQSILIDIKKKQYNPEDMEKDFEEIYEQLSRMSKIIIHMHRFIQDHNDESIGKHNVNEIIINMCFFIHQQFQNHDIIITNELDSGLKKVRCDANLLEKALINIMINAREAVEKTDKEDKSITIKTFNHADDICIEIIDNGCGIPADLITNIFEPFFTTKESLKSFGIGLFMAKEIINSFKGKIEVDSTEKSGSSFRILLPSER